MFKYFPKWIAPNTMTFLGFLLTALNFVLLSYYDWNFFAQTNEEGATPIPDWVWLFAAINIFIAYTLGRLISSPLRHMVLSPLLSNYDVI